MGYLRSLPGNEDRRLTEGPEGGPFPEPIRPATARRGPEPALLVAIALVITIGGLVFKPWTLLGPLGAGPAGNAPAGGPEGTSGQPTVGLSSPQGAPSSGFAVGSSALGGVGPGASASPGLTPRAFLEDLRPIEPDTWAHIS